MVRKVSLGLTQLEAREVPAASMFADIRAGIWGSYPMNLTPSGGALYFSADNGHGYELYRTDGTPGSARMVKDIKPGVGGSNPTNIIPADNGVAYFTANDGTGPVLWRTDGTAAGTTKVPGVPSDAQFMQPVALGRKGLLHFTTRTAANAPSDYVGWWVTDGTTTTRLQQFAGGPDSRTTLRGIDGEVVLVRERVPSDQLESAWKWNGPNLGTRLWQVGLIGNSSLTGRTFLTQGVEIAPGKFVHASMSFSNTVASVWTTDGQSSSSARSLRVFGGENTYVNSPLVKLGNKVFFTVLSNNPEVAGLWVTDGTSAGTVKADLPVAAGVLVPDALTPLPNGRMLIRTGNHTVNAAGRVYITNGTPAGTTEVPIPGGASSAYLAGLIPAGPGEPNGGVLLRAGSPTGPLFRTDGTAAGTAPVDPAGLPSGYTPFGYRTDGFGRVWQQYDRGGVYFNGALYFPAANGEQRSEMWKWDAPPPIVTPDPVAPIVLATTVNDGAAQRSTVTSMIVSFDRRVNFDDGALQLKDATGKVYLLYVESPVQGQDTLNIHFGGKSLPDGRYTLTVKGGKVTDADTGAPLAADYTFTFTRLFGDLNGDGTYDRDTRTLVRNALGARVGDDPRYSATLDVNMDGVIDAADELAAVRNWGKSV